MGTKELNRPAEKLQKEVNWIMVWKAVSKGTGAQELGRAGRPRSVPESQDKQQVCVWFSFCQPNNLHPWLCPALPLFSMHVLRMHEPWHHITPWTVTTCICPTSWKCDYGPPTVLTFGTAMGFAAAPPPWGLGTLWRWRSSFCRTTSCGGIGKSWTSTLSEHNQ